MTGPPHSSGHGGTGRVLAPRAGSLAGAGDQRPVPSSGCTSPAAPPGQGSCGHLAQQLEVSERAGASRVIGWDALPDPPRLLGASHRAWNGWHGCWGPCCGGGGCCRQLHIWVEDLGAWQGAHLCGKGVLGLQEQAAAPPNLPRHYRGASLGPTDSPRGSLHTPVGAGGARGMQGQLS